MDIGGFALIIGGGGGIGKACAVAFAKEGASGVMIADIDLESAALAIAECKRVSERSDFRAEVTSIDVTCESSVKKAVAQTVMCFSRVDYCVICAGLVIQKGKETSLADATDFDRFLDVNVKGTFLATRDVTAAMKLQEPRENDDMGKRGHSRGAIVIMGSVSSFLPQPRQIQYTASKHAVLGIAKNAALDNATWGIRVNCLCPSWVDTPMVQRAVKAVPGLQQTIDKAVPLGRLALPAEIADTAMFLCSPRSSYITGSSIIIDGGTTLMPSAG